MMIITPKPHQIEFANKIWKVLKEFGYVYLAGKPRSGKTLTSILCAEKSDKIKSVIVLTKIAAIPGWHKFIDNMTLKHKYMVINYEQVASYKKITHTKAGRKLKKPKTVITLKLNPDAYDLVIIDESHNLGSLPKPSNRVKAIQMLCSSMPHIHLSGTAIVESPCSIYHQMNISRYSPFHRYHSFYDFFKVFGSPYSIKVGSRNINQYDRANDKLMPYINQFTVYMTQEDAGIDKSLQATDKLHYVSLNDDTKALYNKLQKDFIVDVKGKMLVADSTMKLRTSLHMIESGIVKIDDDYIELGNTEKIDYIKKEFGDSEDIGIMGHFVGERRLLKKHFNNAKIYSSTSDAEGVDLSNLKHFIIISSGYSGAKFIQRRDRIINTEGSNTLTVNHILVKKAISEQVYKKTSKKEDFNNSTYERNTL